MLLIFFEKDKGFLENIFIRIDTDFFQILNIRNVFGFIVLFYVNRWTTCQNIRNCCIKIFFQFYLTVYLSKQYIFYFCWNTISASATLASFPISFSLAKFYQLIWLVDTVMRHNFIPLVIMKTFEITSWMTNVWKGEWRILQTHSRKPKD